jgi:hypothetical protein
MRIKKLKVEIEDYLNRHQRAFTISLGYVGLGTLAVCSIYPSDLFHGEWTLWVLFVTFPVTIISFGFRYAEAEMIYVVFIIQFVMIVLTFLTRSNWIKEETDE